LKRQGWSNRRIALQLSINRKTVDAYVKRHVRVENGPNPPAGAVVAIGPNPLSGSILENGPNPPAGNSGPPSLCQSYQSRIKEMLELELSVKRIYQDLSNEYGFSGSYDLRSRRDRTRTRLSYKRWMPPASSKTAPQYFLIFFKIEVAFI
jgi:hypothetical protein